MIEQLNLRVMKVHPLPSGRIKAFVDVVVNEAILIKGVRIVSSLKGGVFVSMPQEMGKNSRWYERVRCLKPEVRQHVNEVVLDAYQASQQFAV